MTNESHNSLPPYKEFDHKMKVVPESTPPSKAPYRLNSKELKKNLNINKRPFQFGVYNTKQIALWGTSFVCGKKGQVKMCIDYCALNKITIKNNYPMPCIDDLLDQLNGTN